MGFIDDLVNPQIGSPSMPINVKIMATDPCGTESVTANPLKYEKHYDLETNYTSEVNICAASDIKWTSSIKQCPVENLVLSWKSTPPTYLFENSLMDIYSELVCMNVNKSQP